MQALLEIVEKTAAFFAQKGVPNARLDAELLTAHVLGCKRLDLYLQFERLLSEAELDALRPLVKRRSAREPLQYLLGSVPFHEITLLCDRRALIPRPETEALVGLLVERLRDRQPVTICDLGTGTGALALALAKAFPEASVTAVDTSLEALALAQENAAALGLSERLRFLESDWFSALGEERFDLIVSNPPYLTEAEFASAEPEVRDWERRAALVSGADGLDALRIILAGAKTHLNDGGLLACETGIAQHSALEELAKDHGYSSVESIKDDSGRERHYLARII